MAAACALGAGREAGGACGACGACGAGGAVTTGGGAENAGGGAAVGAARPAAPVFGISRRGGRLAMGKGCELAGPAP